MYLERRLQGILIHSLPAHGTELNYQAGPLSPLETRYGVQAGVQKISILDIRDIRQLSLLLENLWLKERQDAGQTICFALRNPQSR